MSELGISSKSETLASAKLLSKEEIEEQLHLYAGAYNNSNIKVHVDSIPKAIEDVKLLTDSLDKDTEEDVGRKLFQNAQDMISSVGGNNLFTIIVDNNFNLEDSKRDCISRRANIEIDLQENLKDMEEILISPDKEIYRLKAKIKINHEAKRIRAENETSKSSNYNLRSKDESEVLTEQNRLEEETRKRIEVMAEEVNDEADMEFVNEHSDYVEKTKIKNAAVKKIRDAKIEQEREIIFEIILKSYQDAMRKMISKIKEAVKRFPRVQNVLKGTAIMITTKEEIPNPLEGNSFPGIMQILYDRYHKKTFVGFTNSLIEAMSWTLSENDTNKSPQKGVSEVEQMFALWERRNLWEQMTKDIFWTAILLKGLHPKAVFRRDVITEVNKFIKNNEDLYKNQDSENSGSKLPVFRFAADFITTEQDNRRLASQPNLDSNQKANPGSGNERSSWSYNNKQRQFGNTEQASAAVEETLLASDKNGKRFSGEVLKTQNIFVQDERNNFKHHYVAVKKLSSICAKCFPENIKDKNTCVPKECYRAKCNKCNMFGHRHFNCLQSHKADGSAIN